MALFIISVSINSKLSYRGWIYQRLLFTKHSNNLMRSLCDIYDVCRSFLKNLWYDVCRFLMFVVDVEIDVVTMTTPSVVTFLTFVEPTGSTFSSLRRKLCKCSPCVKKVPHFCMNCSSNGQCSAPPI